MSCICNVATALGIALSGFVSHYTYVTDVVDLVTRADVYVATMDLWGTTEVDKRSYWIFWEWRSDLGWHIVRDWRHYHGEEIWKRGRYWVLMLDDHGVKRKILARYYRKTETDYDPEIEDGKRWGTDGRWKLTPNLQKPRFGF